MNRNLTFLKTSLVGLFFISASNVWAAEYYVCAGTSLNIAADDVVADASYIWDITDGTNTIPGFIPSENQAFDYTFSTPGTYHVILSQVSTEECTSDPVEHIVHVLPTFTVAITGTAPYCAQNSASVTTTLEATVTPSDPFTVPGVIYTYQWYESDALNAQGTPLGTNPTEIIAGQATAGDYYYTVKVVYGFDGTETGTWLDTPCSADADTPAHVEVYETPGAPTITITAN